MTKRPGGCAPGRFCIWELSTDSYQVTAFRLSLRREAPQRPPNVAFSEPLERPVTQLAHAFARDAEHRAELLESVLASALEPEVETQDLRVARRERVERLLDFIGEKAVHRFLLGVRHFVGDETLDERAVAVGIHWGVEAHVAGVQRGERLDDVHREAGERGQLLGRRFTAHFLPQDLARLD